MSKVIVDMGMSLDGFIAGPNAGPHNNLGYGGTRIHRWVYDLETWRESHPAGPHDDHPFTFIDLRRRRPAASC